jgi:hypothetical protein
MMNKLVEWEEVNDANWKEICHWAEEEWPGGGIASEDDVRFFSSTGTLGLKFHTYKHNPQDPRVLYMVGFSSASYKNDFSLIFDEVFPPPVFVMR